jgi:hypothetical protein
MAMLRSRIQRSAVGFMLVAAASWGVACSEESGGDDTNNSENETTEETSEGGESSETESQSTTSETEESTSSGDADSSEVDGTSADDSSTDEQTTEEPPPDPPVEITPEAIEAACARVEQCDAEGAAAAPDAGSLVAAPDAGGLVAAPDAGGLVAAPDAGSCTPGVDAGSCAEPPAGTCVEELGGAAMVLGAVCPSAFGAYLDCVANMDSCEPEVECAEEEAAFQACEPESAPMLSEELVEMVCANSAECNPDGDTAMCIQEITFGAPVVEAICPGAFIPYMTCLAETTECDSDTACAEEIAVLQACGIDPTSM